MTFDDNEDLRSMEEHLHNSLSNRFRMVYNKGYCQGFNDGVKYAANELAEAMKKDNPQTSKNKWLQILINNAPTVEAVPKEDFDVLKKNYDMISSLLKEEHAKAVGTDTEPLVQVSEVTYSDRPKGEWIDVENEPYCECSVCGSYIDNLDDDYAFCPRCGADMRGENDG